MSDIFAPVVNSQERREQIGSELLSSSRHLKTHDFIQAHPKDLEFLFWAYDRMFFNRWFENAIRDVPLSFRLAPRLTRAAGKTTHRVTSRGRSLYEIAIACSMLFEAFTEGDRDVTVCGIHCNNRLQALQLVFEHEMVHLYELLSFGNSNCSAWRFQQMTAALFGHSAHTHSLITRSERAAHNGIRQGAVVTFVFEGQVLTGRVNKVTRRATVLVEDPSGLRYSDGRHYKKFYVPLRSLSLAANR